MELDANYAAAIEAAARDILGEPNLKYSNARELRFGTRGSLAIDLDKGVYFDHERNEGGGLLDFIRDYKGQATFSDVSEYLTELGFQQNTPRPISNRANSAQKVIESYDYCNAIGDLIFTVDRFGPEKTFKQRRPDGKGGWVHNVRGIDTAIPYRLPQLLQSDDTVYIVEGERDVHSLESLGFIATCNAGGAGKWKAKHSSYLADRDVVILPDHDQAGDSHANKIKASLENIAKSFFILKLDGLPSGGDITDWVARGHTREDLLTLTNERPQQRLSYTITELLDLPQREPVPWPHRYIPAGFTLLAGEPKAGKSKLMEILCGEIALKKPVLYLALEYSAGMAARRFNHVSRDAQLELICAGMIPHFSQGGREHISKLIDRVAPHIIVIDTLAHFKDVAAERGYEGEREALSSLKSFFDEAGIHAVMLHHLRKRTDADDGNRFDRILGSTALRSVPDNNILLTHRDSSTQLAYEGREISAMEKSLRLEGNKFIETSKSAAALESRAPLQAEVLRLLENSGPLTTTQIANELNRSKATVSEAAHALVTKGVLDGGGKGVPFSVPSLLPMYKFAPSSNPEHPEHPEPNGDASSVSSVSSGSSGKENV